MITPPPPPPINKILIVACWNLEHVLITDNAPFPLCFSKYFTL